jgi:hypothetical protein
MRQRPQRAHDDLDAIISEMHKSEAADTFVAGLLSAALFAVSEALEIFGDE